MLFKISVKSIQRIEKYTWNGDDINRLYNLNNACKNLPVPSNWFWAADAEMMIVSRAFSIKNEWNFA